MIHFNVKGFRAIMSAPIEIPGVAVLAGGNGCGKSTISKLLYYLLDTATRYGTFVDLQTEPIVRAIWRKAVDLVLNFVYTYNQLSEEARHEAFPKPGTHPKAWVASMEKYFAQYAAVFMADETNCLTFVERSKKSFETTDFNVRTATPQGVMQAIAELIDRVESRAEQDKYARPLALLRDRLTRVLEEPVELNSLDLRIDGNELIKLASGRLDAPVQIKRVYYVDTPWVSDLVDSNAGRMYEDDVRLSHRSHLAKVLRTARGNVDRSLFDIMQGVVRGRSQSVRTDTGYRATFDSEDFKRTFNLFHCATGIKAFSILQMLLSAGKLDSETLLILDEPESNLHPQWVVEYARVIVMLQRLLGVKFLVATHSTDLVAGLQAIAKKAQIEDSVRFYLAEQDNESKRFTFVDKGFDIGEIFDSFNLSLDKITEYGADVD